MTEQNFIGTSPTKNDVFDREGYLVIEDLVDPKELYTPIPDSDITGSMIFYGSLDKFEYDDIEDQVPGSFARKSYPPYKESFYNVKNRLESVIGRKLYPTYYYDRVYRPGQDLPIHSDRPACEISVSINIGTNLSDPWPLNIKTCSGEDRSVILNPGDGMVYKGCERPHWRDPMPGVKRNKIRKLFNQEEFYYHQVFFHYVLQDGMRAHHAWDAQRKR